VLPAFYLDLGLSGGMRAALRLYAEEHIPLELRWLFTEEEYRYAPGYAEVLACAEEGRANLSIATTPGGFAVRWRS
jgi:hypothetical protein